MKRFLRFFLAAAAVVCLCVPVLAAGNAELVRTFVYDNTLYTYVSLSGVTEPITKAEASLDGQVFPASDTLKTVRQAGSPVVEMLLVDCSNSMPDFQEDVIAFARELAKASGENTRFLLATFGRDFTVLSEDLSGAELAEAIHAVTYTATQTRLNTSLGQALDYFAALPRSGNELRSVIVLSDAVQYDPQGGIPLETLSARLEESDVLLHSVGFGNDTDALSRLAGLVDASQGIHLEVGTDLTALEAADRLASYTGDLLVTGFQLGAYSSEGGTQPVTVTFGSGAQLVCRGTSEVELPASGNSAVDTTKPPSGEASACRRGGNPGIGGGSSPGRSSVRAFSALPHCSGGDRCRGDRGGRGRCGPASSEGDLRPEEGSGACCTGRQHRHLSAAGSPGRRAHQSHFRL